EYQGGRGRLAGGGRVALVRVGAVRWPSAPGPRKAAGGGRRCGARGCADRGLRGGKALPPPARGGRHLHGGCAAPNRRRIRVLAARSQGLSRRRIHAARDDPVRAVLRALITAAVVRVQTARASGGAPGGLDGGELARRRRARTSD